MSRTVPVPTTPDQETAMPETSTAAPLLTVTWDTVIGSRPTGYSESDTGYVEYEPVNLGDAVTQALASQLMAQVQGDAAKIRRDALEELRQEIRNVRVEVTREEIREIVREALAGDITPTDPFGYKTGEPTTLRALLRKDVEAYLKEPTPNRGSYERQGGFRELLKEEVDKALSKELRDTIREARKDVAARVKDKAAEIIGAVVQAETR